LRTETTFSLTKYIHFTGSGIRGSIYILQGPLFEEVYTFYRVRYSRTYIHFTGSVIRGSIYILQGPLFEVSMYFKKRDNIRLVIKDLARGKQIHCFLFMSFLRKRGETYLKILLANKIKWSLKPGCLFSHVQSYLLGIFRDSSVPHGKCPSTSEC